jgi:predicted nuclease of predicted toxin-antitoxin system
VRFYLDEDLNPLTARLLRARGIDAVSVHEQGTTGRPDNEHLDHAAGENRCLVTANRDDFIRLTQERLATAKRHAGVLIVTHRLRLRSPATVAAALARYHGTHPGDLAPYTVDFLAAPRG